MEMGTKEERTDTMTAAAAAAAAVAVAAAAVGARVLEVGQTMILIVSRLAVSWRTLFRCFVKEATVC